LEGFAVTIIGATFVGVLAFGAFSEILIFVGDIAAPAGLKTIDESLPWDAEPC